MKSTLYTLIFLVLSVVASRLLTLAQAQRDGTSDENISMDGPCPMMNQGPCNRSVAHIILGGLFPVHGYDAERSKCNSQVSLEALQWVEAFRHAIELVNLDKRLLPGLQLGYAMRDTCGDERLALRRSLGFVGSPPNCNNASEGDLPPPGSQDPDVIVPLVSRVAGVVGPYTSQMSIAITDLFRLFQVPVVGFAATSSQLSDKQRFPFFLRTIASDKISSRALVQLARQKLNWTFINVVKTDDSFGKAGAKEVADLFSRPSGDAHEGSEPCVGSDSATAKSFGLLADPPTEEEVKKTWELLLNTSPQNRSNGVVLFTQSRGAREFFKIGERDFTEGANQRNLTFLGVGAWGDTKSVIAHGKTIAKGSVNSIPYRPPVWKFNKHFGSLDPERTKDNPWLAEGWKQTFQCTLDEPSCARNNLTDPMYFVQNSKVPFIYDAVFAFAHAFHDIYLNDCQQKDALKCNSLKDAKRALEALQAVSFPTITGDIFKFDRNGDPANATYVLKNVVVEQNSNEITFPIVGFYHSWQRSVTDRLECENLGGVILGSHCTIDSMSIDMNQVVWNDGTLQPPESKCSPDCQPGNYTSTSDYDLSCCWSCRQCARNSYSNHENVKGCLRCRDNQKTVGNDRTSCVRVRVEEWSISEPFAVAMAILALFGVIAVLFALAWTVLHWHSFFPMGREPTVLCLVSFLIIYSSLLLEVNGPTAVVCGFGLVFQPLGYATILGTFIFYALYRLCIVSTLPQAAFCFQSHRRALTSLILVLPPAVLLLFAMVLSPPGVSSKVTKHVKEELSCSTTIAEDIITAYILVCFLVNLSLCISVLRKEHHKKYVFEVDHRPRVLYFSAIASGINVFLFICYLIVDKVINDTPVVQGGVASIFILLSSTALLLLVFTQQLRQLGPLTDIEEQWLNNLHKEVLKHSANTRMWRTGTVADMSFPQQGRKRSNQNAFKTSSDIPELKINTNSKLVRPHKPYLQHSENRENSSVLSNGSSSEPTREDWSQTSSDQRKESSV